MQLQHTMEVHIHIVSELFGHDVYPAVGKHIVIVMMGQGMAIRMQREGPESIEGNVLAQLQSSVHQHET